MHLTALLLNKKAMYKNLLGIFMLSCFTWSTSQGQIVAGLEEITNNTSYGTSYTSPDGLVFSIDGGGVSEFVGLDYIGQNSGNGIDIVIVSGAISTLTITRDGGGYFIFNSIYLRDGFGDANVTVRGFDGAIETNISSFDMFMQNDIYTFDWSGLDKITISSTDLSLAFDNASFTLPAPLFEDDLADGSDAISIDENTSVATVIYNVNANDGDGGPTDADVVYSIISGNNNRDGDATNPFIIDTNTGQISIADADDLELDPVENFTLVIQADNGNTDNNTSSATLAITINDINDINPVVNPDQEFTIGENLANTEAVGVVSAIDYDLNPAVFQDWTIVSGNTDGAFAIDANTGVITVANQAALDRELVDGFILKITVSDGVNTSAEEGVSILLTDVNDNIPVVTQAMEFSIDENLANAEPVGTVTATDDDITSTVFQNWTIVSGNTDGAFAINASSGLLTVASQGALDKEQIDSFILIITVSDGVNTSAEEAVTILLNDVNDNTPVIAADQSFMVLEGAENGSSIGFLTATDADITSSLQDWTLVSGNTDGVFDLNINTGEITVSGNGDFAAQASYALEVTVSDGLNTSALQLINVAVNYKPVFAQDPYTATIDDDAPIGTTLIVVEATDPEAGEVIYSITGGNDDNLFAIDALTGEITTTGLLDGVANPDYLLEVSATENNGLLQVTTVNVTVNHIAITGLADMPENKLSLYPNPSSGRFIIDLEDQESYTLQMFDLDSKLMADLGKVTNGGEVNISSYPQGVYLLRIGFDQQVILKKVIISK
jgi:hypothetical protein